MAPSEWIDTLLQRHDIEKPDGRPLYQYRLSEQEFAALTDLLKLSARLGINEITEMRFWDAAFVMYGAEWWRRYYTGEWGWGGVFDSIGINSIELSPVKRNSLVESGLQRWRRDVRAVGGTRKFLGTVATEGGLPLNRLQGSGGWLRNVLQPSLRKHLSRGINISVLIVSYEDLIPPSYRSEELSQILTDIAETVVTLRQDYELKDREEPLAWLDANRPGWRELFPLPMDDNQARSLLGDLIDAASRAKIGDAAKTPFEIERVLVGAETDSPELIAQIDPPTFVFLDDSDFLTGRTDIPSSMELEVYEPGGDSWPWCRAIATTYKDRKALKLSGTSLRLKGEQAVRELRLRFKHIGECLLDVPIPGGEHLDSDLPWLFRNVEGKWMLQGTASQAVKDKDALVFVPASCRFSCQDEDTEISRCGRLLSGALLKLSGVMHCCCGDARYQLSAGLEESLVQFDLKGKKCPFPSTPRDIYIGQPELVETNIVSGHALHCHNADLKAKKIGADEAWRPLSQAEPGYYEIRLIDGDGNTQLRKRVGILAEDFRVEIKPDPQQVKAGVISLCGTTGLEVAVSDEQLSFEVSSMGGRKDIRVEADDEPPLSINVSLLPGEQKKIISMTLPYPSKGALLFDAAGLPASLTTPLHLSHLRGYRLKLFNDRHREGEKTDLFFSLIDTALENAMLVRSISKNRFRCLGGSQNLLSMTGINLSIH